MIDTNFSLLQNNSIFMIEIFLPQKNWLRPVFCETL